MKKTNDGMLAYTERLKPQIRLFYRAAHALTGSRQVAECALSNAILNAFLQRGEWRERMSFREGVLRAVREESRIQLKKGQEADWDWNGVTAEAGSEQTLIQLLSKEPPETQRSMVLRFGCSMTAREIAQITSRPHDQVRDELARCQVRMERELRKREIAFKPFDRYAVKEIRQWMNRESSEPIDAGYFLSTFEKDAVSARHPRHIVAGIIKWMLAGIGALLLAACVWLIAVLMEM